MAFVPIRRTGPGAAFHAVSEARAAPAGGDPRGRGALSPAARGMGLWARFRPRRAGAMTAFVAPPASGCLSAPVIRG